MSQSRIPEAIVSLEFPDIERVVLAGSGVLELNGIRPAQDIDLATRRKNIDHLFETDPEHWTRKVNTFKRITDGTSFERTSVEDVDGRFDIWKTWYHAGRPQGDRIVRLDELLKNSVQHELGFHVLKLEYVMDMKAHARRPKDLSDLRRYHQWLENGY